MCIFLEKTPVTWQRYPPILNPTGAYRFWNCYSARISCILQIAISILPDIRGTGMIASSSTYRPRPGRVIRDLLRLLNAVYSSYLARTFGRIASGIPWFLRSTTEPTQQVHALV